MKKLPDKIKVLEGVVYIRRGVCAKSTYMA